MRLFEVVPAVFCVALLGATFSPIAKADDWNNKTTVTFSAPVEILGVHLKGWGVLPAGTYVFKFSRFELRIAISYRSRETREPAVVAQLQQPPIYDVHTQAEEAVKKLQSSEFGDDEALDCRASRRMQIRSLQPAELHAAPAM